MLTRRDMLRAAVGSAATLTIPGLSLAQPAGPGFTLPKLPYAFDALEPHIDAETMQIHHGRHHQAYVDNLNKALSSGAPEWLTKPIEEVVANYAKLPEAIRTAVRNNGGGHLNHTWFWSMMAKAGSGGTGPTGELAKAIDASFGGLDGFKKEFAAAALGRFGSGWAWLVIGKDKPLAITSTANQDNPIMEGGQAILGIDVWEHAYYLKYRNVRAKYVEAWFNVIHWNLVNDLYAKAAKK